MPRNMPPSKQLKTRVSDEINAALEAYCKEHGIEMSAFVRGLICQGIGKPELAETMPPEGRPRKDRKPPAPPAKKRR